MPWSFLVSVHDLSFDPLGDSVLFLKTPYFEYFTLETHSVQTSLKGLNLHFQTMSWDKTARRRINL